MPTNDHLLRVLRNKLPEVCEFFEDDILPIAHRVGRIEMNSDSSKTSQNGPGLRPLQIHSTVHEYKALLSAMIPDTNKIIDYSFALSQSEIEVMRASITAFSLMVTADNVEKMSYFARILENALQKSKVLDKQYISRVTWERMKKNVMSILAYALMSGCLCIAATATTPAIAFFLGVAALCSAVQLLISCWDLGRSFSLYWHKESVIKAHAAYKVKALAIKSSLFATFTDAVECKESASSSTPTAPSPAESTLSVASGSVKSGQSAPSAMGLFSEHEPKTYAEVLAFANRNYVGKVRR